VTLLLSILDSQIVKIIFAVWTGVYLVQILRGQETDGSKELLWVVIAFGITFLFIPASTTNPTAGAIA
jgi:hypothetical protein